jgi:hypothetical protein
MAGMSKTPQWVLLLVISAVLAVGPTLARLIGGRGAVKPASE